MRGCWVERRITRRPEHEVKGIELIILCKYLDVEIRRSYNISSCECRRLAPIPELNVMGSPLKAGILLQTPTRTCNLSRYLILFHLQIHFGAHNVDPYTELAILHPSPRISVDITFTPSADTTVLTIDIDLQTSPFFTIDMG